MKKPTKVALIILLILMVGVFIHPRKVIYQANVQGKVTDKNNQPVAGAIVYRIKNEYFKNKEIGSIECKELQTESVRTDKNGNFKLHEKSRIDWLHSPLDLPVGYCHASFEIEKKGFITYKTEFGEFRQFRKKDCYTCEEIEFKPIIILKRNNH